MIDEKYLTETMEIAKRYSFTGGKETADSASDFTRIFASFLQLSGEVLSAKLPEKIKHSSECAEHRPMFQFCNCGAKDLNEANDLFRLVLARDYVKREEVEMNGITDEDIEKLNQARLEYAGSKYLFALLIALDTFLTKAGKK